MENAQKEFGREISYNFSGGKPKSRSSAGIFDPGVIAAKAFTEVIAIEAAAKKERKFIMIILCEK